MKEELIATLVQKGFVYNARRDQLESKDADIRIIEEHGLFNFEFYYKKAHVVKGISYVEAMKVVKAY